MSCSIMYHMCDHPSEALKEQRIVSSCHTQQNALVAVAAASSLQRINTLPSPQPQTVSYMVDSANNHHAINSARRSSPHLPDGRPPFSNHDDGDDSDKEKTFKRIRTSGEESSVETSNVTSPLIVHQRHQDISVTEQRVPNDSAIKHISANCILVTHYRGETSDVVDEHFQRALQTKDSSSADGWTIKVCSPTTSIRSFPPSFYQPHFSSKHLGYGSPLSRHCAADLYEAYHHPGAGLHHSIQGAGHDPWTYSLSSQVYGHRGMGNDMYHVTGAAASHTYQQYAASLGFQQSHFSRFPAVSVHPQVAKTEGASWSSRYYEAFGTTPVELPNGLESAYPAPHYHAHNMPGLDASMNQECGKDLYWGLS